MNKRSLLYSLIAVLLMGMLITGSSFAYFQWTSSASKRTNVNTTIKAGQITMHIEPSNTVMTGLMPTSFCSNSYASSSAKVTIVNNTGAIALPTFKLKVKVTKGGSGELTSEDLSHIHYAVFNYEEEYGVVACDSPYFGGYDDGQGALIASGDFQNVSTTGEWTDVGPLDWVYDESLHKYVGITFEGIPGTTTTHNFGVEIWIDSGYTSTVVGDVITDPLQNAIIEVTWSENSIVEQVAKGEIDNGGVGGEVVYGPGYYDSSGNFTSWDKLILDEIIGVTNGTLNYSRTDMEGLLVLPNTITAIGDEVWIETELFIPTSVVSIGTNLVGLMSSGVYYEGTQTQWNNISIAADNSILYISSYNTNWEDLVRNYIPDFES